MKWLKRKLRNWINDTGFEGKQGMIASCREVEAAVADADPILNFRVFSAVGGQVVEFRTYDRLKDRSNTTTYIIHKDDNFGEKIAKIATLEMMK